MPIHVIIDICQNAFQAAQAVGWQTLRRRVRLRQLELLAALEHAPTLSAAAREARLSQPAASKLLGALSDDLAIALFEKAGRSLRPTAAGRALIRHAANLVGNLDRAQAEIEAIESGLSGTVAVGAGIGACYVLMPRASLSSARSGA